MSQSPRSPDPLTPVRASHLQFLAHLDFPSDRPLGASPGEKGWNPEELQEAFARAEELSYGQDPGAWGDFAGSLGAGAWREPRSRRRPSRRSMGRSSSVRLRQAFPEKFVRYVCETETVSLCWQAQVLVVPSGPWRPRELVSRRLRSDISSPLRGFGHSPRGHWRGFCTVGACIPRAGDGGDRMSHRCLLIFLNALDRSSGKLKWWCAYVARMHWRSHESNMWRWQKCAVRNQALPRKRRAQKSAPACRRFRTRRCLPQWLRTRFSCSGTNTSTYQHQHHQQHYQPNQTHRKQLAHIRSSQAPAPRWRLQLSWAEEATCSFPSGRTRCRDGLRP